MQFLLVKRFEKAMKKKNKKKKQEKRCQKTQLKPGGAEQSDKYYYSEA